MEKSDAEFPMLNDKKTHKSSKYIGVAIIILAVISYLFRGSLAYGLEFDEVSRLINLIPLFNKAAYPVHQSILDLPIFGLSIPLMFKTYISSLAIFFYLPMGIFNNYLFAIRFLDFFYFYIFIMGFFFIAAKYDIRLSFVISLLTATSPLFYPEVRFGAAAPYHIFFIALSLHLFYRYFNETNSLLDLFFAVFFLAFAANVRFYVLWIIAAMILAGVICFPQYLRHILSSLARSGVAVSAFIVGLLNFVIYNLFTGFATVRPLYLRIFDRAAYNQQPIDYKNVEPLLSSIARKLGLLLSFLGPYHSLYILVGGLILLAHAIALYRVVKDNKWTEYRKYFFPIITCVLILIFILLSPNTTRPGHYVYMLPFYEFSLVASMLLMYKLFGKYNPVRAFVVILPVFALFLNFYSSNVEVEAANRTSGTGYFSPAIFDLKSFLDKEGIDYGQVIHTQWGLAAQLYFLNKGQVPPPGALIWNLAGARTDGAKSEVLQSFFVSKEEPFSAGDLYFPIYNNKQKATSTLFFNFVRSNGGELIRIKQFYEKNGKPVFALYRLRNSKEFVGRVARFHPYHIFTDEEENGVLSSDVDFSKGDYQYVRGLYQYEGGFRWSGGSSAVLLKYSDERYLHVHIIIPALANYGSEDIKLQVKVNDTLIRTYAILKSGDIDDTIRIPKGIEKRRNAVVGLDMNRQWKLPDSSPDTRKLSFIVKQVGFTSFNN